MHHLSSDREMVNTLHYSPNVCRDIQHYTQYFNKSKQNFYWQGRNRDPTSTDSFDLSSWLPIYHQPPPHLQTNFQLNKISQCFKFNLSIELSLLILNFLSLSRDIDQFCVLFFYKFKPIKCSYLIVEVSPPPRLDRLCFNSLEIQNGEGLRQDGILIFLQNVFPHPAVQRVK